MEIGLSLGANQGDRLAQLIAIKQRIIKLPGVTLAAQSPVYETAPVEVPPEFSRQSFLNAVLILETLLPVRQFLRLCQLIEQKFGRAPHAARGTPRPADIDIIYADQLSIEEEHLVIPHPRWAQRRFVAQPLGDVRPDLRIPGRAGTVSEVLAGLPDQGPLTLIAAATSW